MVRAISSNLGVTLTNGEGDGDAVTVDGERGVAAGDGVAQTATDPIAVPVCCWDTGRRWNGAKMRQALSRLSRLVRLLVIN
jgi:hypothetical protein